jgi:thiol-disulfide isomerase/thioredoxin
MALIKKYGFWILLGAVAIYWGYRKWPHEIAVDDIQVYNDQNQLENYLISGDSALIVHFFASWCGPCMRELPEWTSHLKELRAAGFQVVCITDDTPAIVQRLKDNYILPIKRTESLQDLNVFSIPMSYIYNTNGQQVKRIEGPLEWSNPELINELQKLK